MQVHETIDPRDPWERVRRMEVFRYAQELRVPGIEDRGGIPPKDLMVAQLKALKIPPPTVPPRTIGAVDPRMGDTSPDSHHFKGQTQPQRQPETVELTALDVLTRDWQAQQSKPVDQMTITEARKECKARGIKMARTDNLASLKEKLRG